MLLLKSCRIFNYKKMNNNYNNHGNIQLSHFFPYDHSLCILINFNANF